MYIILRPSAGREEIPNYELNSSFRASRERMEGSFLSCPMWSRACALGGGTGRGGAPSWAARFCGALGGAIVQQEERELFPCGGSKILHLCLKWGSGSGCFWKTLGWHPDVCFFIKERRIKNNKKNLKNYEVWLGPFVHSFSGFSYSPSLIPFTFFWPSSFDIGILKLYYFFWAGFHGKTWPYRGAKDTHSRTIQKILSSSFANSASSAI